MFIIVASNFGYSQANISRIEYFVDADPGIGNAIPINISPATNIQDAVIPINTNTLSTGIHHLYARAQDANGKWSLTNTFHFYKPYPVNPARLPANIDVIEYYIDKDPGIGLGKKVAITPGVNLADVVLPINTDQISPCVHTVYVRCKDTLGSWSMINSYTFVNETTNITATPQDFMVQLDGVNDYLDLGTWFKVPNFTISFWIKPDSIQTAGAAVVALQNDLYLYSNPTAQDNYILSHLLQFDMLPGKWNHITITVDSATRTRKVYLFGQLIDENQWAYNPNNGFNVRFGNGGFFPDAYFKGQIDEVRLWNTVFSADEVYGNIRRKLTGNENGLLGYWDFNNGCATAATDVSSNGHISNLINGAAKLPSTVPEVGQQIIPNKAGTGLVTVKIYDNLFKQGAIAKLTRNGFPDIIADTTAIDNDGLLATCSFNLKNKQIGLYNLILRNPDTTEKVYLNSFTIEQGIPPAIWVDIVSRNAVRNSRPFKFEVAYGNTGNVDAKGVIVWVLVKGDTLFKVVPNFKIERDTTNADSLSVDSIPVFYSAPRLRFREVDVPATVVPIYIPSIPAGTNDIMPFTADIDINIQNITEFEVEVIVDRPLNITPNNTQNGNDGHNNEESNASECVGGIISKAEDAILDKIPGAGCIKSSVETINDWRKYHSNEDGAPTKNSLLWNTASTIAGCAFDFIPQSKILEAAVEAMDFINDLGTIIDCYKAFRDLANSRRSIRFINSFDPNEKVGPNRYQQTHNPFNYSIFFENKATATAPAQEVIIIDTLDKTKFDISTFSFGLLGFGGTISTSTYQYNKKFSVNIDLRPVKNLLVKAEGRVDTTAGIAYWKFMSLDPATMLLTDDPEEGFLPPADSISNRGEGWVSYNVKPYPYLESGTPIENRATIIFDNNAPIITNTHGNVIDKVPPISNVKPLRSIQADSNFTVQWTGKDSIISGIKNWDIYVSDNLSPYQYWKTNTSDSVAIFTGHPGHEYRFYSIAKDSADNTEASKSHYEAITFVTLSIADSICIGDNGKIIATTHTPGNVYRWQVNTGSGYADVINSAIYAGTNRDTLTLTSPPSSFSGYLFRCIITNGASTDTTKAHELFFANLWTGNVSDAWENAANWDCNHVPDANTDVIIKKDAVRFPVVRSNNAICKSVKAPSGTSVNVQDGFKLTVTGNKQY